MSRATSPSLPSTTLASADEDGRGDRSPHREAGGRRHRDGKGDERDLVGCDAREDGEQRGCDHPLREDAVEPGSDWAVERLARASQDVAAAVTVLARRVDIEPPLFIADGQRTGDTRVGQHLDGTGETGVADGDRRLDRVKQRRAADERADLEGVVPRELLAIARIPASAMRTFMASSGSTPAARPSRVSTATRASPGSPDACLSCAESDGENTWSAITRAKG